MLDNQKTENSFGYKIENLTSGSHKNVVVACDYCGREKIIQYKNYLQSLDRFSSIGLSKYNCKLCSVFKTQEVDKILGRAEIKKEKIKSRQKETCLKKYGVEYPSQNKEIINKVKNSWKNKTQEEIQEIKKRAVETFNKDPENKIKKSKKFRQTSLERYGVDNPSQVEVFKKKRELTSLDKYGVSNFSLHPDCRKRISSTWQKKYNTDHIFKLPKIQEKIKSTNLKKYGKEFPTRRYGKTENEIKKWLNSFGFNFDSNSSTLEGKQIDLYDDNLKLGIEYCGLYWHNEISLKQINKNYHFNKYKKAQLKGVRLITIFEDEWLTRNFQVKSFLRAALNKNEIKIGARSCKIKFLDKIEASKFFDSYHIQGSNLLSYLCCGLYFNDKLVAAMSFGRHPRKSDVIVLDRLCFKENVSVVGGSSKMFKFLKNQSGINKIVSWSDNRWSMGTIYKKLGFILEEESGPDYSYYDSNNGKRLSKQSQRKSSNGCPKEVTERNYCLSRGLFRIWDCGKKRWMFEIKK